MERTPDDPRTGNLDAPLGEVKLVQQIRKPDPRGTRIAHGAGIGVCNLIHIDTLPFLHLRMDVLSVLQKTLHDRILNRFVFGKREQGLLFQTGFHLFTGHCACAMANACPRFKRVVGLEMPSMRRDSMSAYPWERESSLSFLERIQIYMTEVGVVIGI